MVTLTLDRNLLYRTLARSPLFFEKLLKFRVVYSLVPLISWPGGRACIRKERGAGTVPSLVVEVEPAQPQPQIFLTLGIGGEVARHLFTGGEQLPDGRESVVVKGVRSWQRRMSRSKVVDGCALRKLGACARRSSSPHSIQSPLGCSNLISLAIIEFTSLELASPSTVAAKPSSPPAASRF